MFVENDDDLILFLDIVLLFLWVGSPKLFLDLLYIMTDVANELFNTFLL